MHETSIACAIWDLARDHVPAGAVLRAVRVSAGPMRGIEHESMQWAWRALLEEQKTPNVELELTILPWKVRCGHCDRVWNCTDFPLCCRCGSRRIRPLGGDELKLIAIEVDDEPASVSKSGSCV